MTINKQIAWNATQNLFIVMGATGSVAFAATLQWWMCLFEAGAMALAWFLIYRIESMARNMTYRDTIHSGEKIETQNS